MEIAQEKTDRPRGEYPPRKDLQNGPTEVRKREEAKDLTENQGIIKKKVSSVKRIRKTTADNYPVTSVLLSLCNLITNHKHNTEHLQ